MHLFRCCMPEISALKVIYCGSRHPHRSSTARGTWSTSDIPPLPDFSYGGSIASGKPGFVERPQVTVDHRVKIRYPRVRGSHLLLADSWESEHQLEKYDG